MFCRLVLTVAPSSGNGVGVVSSGRCCPLAQSLQSCRRRHTRRPRCCSRRIKRKAAGGTAGHGEAFSERPYRCCHTRGPPGLSPRSQSPGREMYGPPAAAWATGCSFWAAMNSLRGSAATGGAGAVAVRAKPLPAAHRRVAIASRERFVSSSRRRQSGRLFVPGRAPRVGVPARRPP